MLLAMNLPVSVPLSMPAVGAMFAIIVVKQLFGGLREELHEPGARRESVPLHRVAFSGV